ARINAKLSVNDIAVATGYDKSTIYKIERGDITASDEYKAAFSNYANLQTSELPILAAKDFRYNEYVENIIKTIRASIPRKTASRLQLTKKKCKYNYSTQKELHDGILQLLFNEALNSDGHIQFLWTGRNYEEFSSFYTDLYEKYIPALVASGTEIHHLLRDG